MHIFLAVTHNPRFEFDKTEKTSKLCGKILSRPSGYTYKESTLGITTFNTEANNRSKRGVSNFETLQKSSTSTFGV